MLQLVVTLDKKSFQISNDSSSGKWEIYLVKTGQIDRVEQKYFGSDKMDEELKNAIQALAEWNKKLTDPP